MTPVTYRPSLAGTATSSIGHSITTSDNVIRRYLRRYRRDSRKTYIHHVPSKFRIGRCRYDTEMKARPFDKTQTSKVQLPSSEAHVGIACE